MNSDSVGQCVVLVMAASDSFDIEVNGKGGHGAAPHDTVDAVLEAAVLVQNLHTIVSRSVVSVGDTVCPH